MGNLSRESFDLRLENIQRVNLPDSVEGTRTRVVENDLLFSITAEIGMLGLIPANFEEAYINQHVGLIRFLKEATRHGDGWQGWQARAPFDAIIVTTGSRT